MALTPVRPQDMDKVLSQQNGPLTKLYKVAAPFATITIFGIPRKYFSPTRNLFFKLLKVLFF